MQRSVAFLLFLLPAIALMAAGGSEEGTEASAGAAATAMPETRFSEAPMLAALVAAGELPPVDERLPIEPAVAWFAPGDVVGTYGGTLTVFHTNESPWNDLAEETETGGYFGRMVKGSLDVVPSMAKALEFSDDAMALTVHLREGLKWSDGHPMTADDVVFMYEALHFNDLVPTWNWIPQIRRAIKIDDYTVRLETDVPYVPDVLQDVDGRRRRLECVPSQALPGEVAHRLQPGRRCAGQGRGFRVVGQGVPPLLLVEPVEGPGQAYAPPVDHDRGHQHRETLRAQPLLLGGRPGRQPAPLRRPDPGADRGPGDLPSEDYFG